MMNLPEIVAHRGYTLHYPENTLPGIKAAIDAGARYVEVDIQLSADQVPYLFHDHDLQRICQQPGAVHEYSAAQLDEFHAADPQRFGQHFQHLPLTRLSQLVELLSDHPGVHAFIELKRSSLKHFGIDTVVNCVTHLLRGIKPQCSIISYSLESLLEARQLGWDSIGAVVDHWEDRQQPLISEIQPEFLFCDDDGLPASGQLEFEYGDIVIFEVADPVRAMELYRRGVGFIETYACGELIRALQN